MDSRGVAASMLGAVGILALLLAPSAAVAEEAPAGDGPAAPAGPAHVAVPYLGEAQVKPAEGWRITDCAPVLASGKVVTSCDAEQFTVAKPEYDPDFGTAVVSVPASNGRTSAVFDYFVELDPPASPTLAVGRYAYPVAAGATTLLPQSDLGIECEACAGGGSLEVVAVSPADAGSAGANGTHLVFRPSAGASGPVEIVLRFADRYGNASADATIVVPVYRPGESGLVATSVYAPLESAPTSLELLPLAFSADGEPVRLIGCGRAVHGTVVCSPDGTAEFAPRGDGVDQFSYHVVSASGEQATGSVTFVPEGAELPTSGAVAASAVAGEPVASAVVPRAPSEDASSGRSGSFVDLIATLDRVGVR